MDSSTEMTLGLILIAIGLLIITEYFIFGGVMCLIGGALFGGGIVQRKKGN